MESLNSYVSDGESDSSSNITLSKKSTISSEEVDANCEPITMDMSEDSSDGQSDNKSKVEKLRSKRYYSRSLSPSPPTSFSSRDSSPSNKKSRTSNSRERTIRSSSERSKSGSIKDKRFDDDKRRDDRYKRDDEQDKRCRDDKAKYKYRNKNKNLDHYCKRNEKKRSYRSKSRSRSSSYSRHRSSKRRHKSRSRSHSYERYRHYKRSPKHSHRCRSPPRSKKSRSKSPSREKLRSYDWKSSSKLKVLEKLGIELKVPPGGIDISQSGVVSSVSSNGGQLTPQLLLQKTMEEQVEKVKSATGITLPSYYNPIAVNPMKYAEQIQKRRLLWGNKDKLPHQGSISNGSSEQNTASNVTENKNSSTIWKGATFGGDQDGKMTAKFQRLMGIKNVEKNIPPTEIKEDNSDLIKKQEEMFHSMESQYEVARLATHSHRGLGLGFGTFQPR